MTISEDTIKSAVLRYHREYDRYLKLSARVAEICRFEIVEGNAIRFESNMDKHHHFVCEECGRVEDVEWFDVAQLANRGRLGRHTIRQYEIVMRGFCSSCQ